MPLPISDSTPGQSSWSGEHQRRRRRSADERGLIERFRARLQALPGIESVSYSSRGIREDVRAQARQGGAGRSIAAEVNLVGPDYLRTHGLTPIAGRELAIERGAAATPAVVTQGLAERLWPGQPAVGRRLFYGRQREREAEIVGVAPNVLFNGNRVSGNSYLLLPASDDVRDPGERTLYLRSIGRWRPWLRRSVKRFELRFPSCRR